jgi:dolichol-phosphate mannosyltransferase
MKIVIVIPTYNERDNISMLVAALQDECRRLRHDMHILVVDDNSPDGTGELVRELMREYSNLHLITGEKQGLGAAYIRGIEYALNMMAVDAIFEMDADLSHDPADVPRLLAELERDADFVIGSRYVLGGSIPEEWGWHRRLNSQFGNIVARYLAGIYRVRDCTAGFRAIKADVLKQIDFSLIRVQGYAFQVALLSQALTVGAVVKEIPVHFIDRKYGQSKLGLADIVEFIVNACWLRLHSSKTFIKFGLVGLSGVLVNLGFFTILLELGLNKFIASPVAIELSIIWNFLLNNYWTFSHRKTKDKIRIKGLKSNFVSLLSLGVSFTTVAVLMILLPRQLPQVHQLLGVLPAFLVNYFLNSYWTFSSVEESSAGQQTTPRTVKATP